jgi:hypothetical protein
VPVKQASRTVDNFPPRFIAMTFCIWHGLISSVRKYHAAAPLKICS